MAKAKPKTKPKKKNGGKREGAGRKPGSVTKDPRALMKDMGVKSEWLSPVEFCLAVINNDPTLDFGLDAKTRRKRRPTIGQMIEAARIAAPYFHQKLPELVEQNVTHSWADMVRKGEERLRTMRKPDAQPIGKS